MWQARGDKLPKDHQQQSSIETLKNHFATFIDAQHRFNYPRNVLWQQQGFPPLFFFAFVAILPDRNMTQFVIFNLSNYHKCARRTIYIFLDMRPGPVLDVRFLYMFRLFLVFFLLFVVPNEIFDYWIPLRIYCGKMSGAVKKPQDLRPDSPRDKRSDVREVARSPNSKVDFINLRQKLRAENCIRWVNIIICRKTKKQSKQKARNALSISRSKPQQSGPKGK